LWFPEDIRLFPHVLFNRAEAYLRTGKEQNALRDYRAFIFAAPAHEKVGLVLYRIGDVLSKLGAEREKVLGAWRECIFKVPETLAARLCEARKAALEMSDAKPELWPRLIGRMEGALPDAKKDFWKGLRSDDLQAYVALMISDAFIRRDQPAQAMFRLKPMEKLSIEPYLQAWVQEYSVTALAGVMAERVKQKKYKEVIQLYEENRDTLLYRQTRAEALWYVAQACRGLGLWEQADESFRSAEKVKLAIHREVPRPYDPDPAEWLKTKAEISIELLERGKAEVKEVAKNLEQLSPDRPGSQRLWIRFARTTNDAKLGLKWWEKLSNSDALSWAEIKSFSELLKRNQRNDERAELLEKNVGVWFSEHERVGTTDAPSTDLLLDLAETRGAGKSPETALPVYEYLSRRPASELTGDGISLAMVSYKKGLLLKKLGRFDDARQSFEQAFKSEPNSVWGQLASSAQKDMKTSPSPAGSR
jgi:tetratricopeptide (TPR) repeat protein